MAESSDAMEMPGWLDKLGGVVERWAGFWQRLGDLESRVYADELAKIAIDRPIYVAGLARAGTTILLELLAERPGVATHRYRDFPPVLTPLFWNRAFAQIYRSDTPPTERAHKDRILVTPDSPEALEEVLWMRFFPRAHDTAVSQVLDAGTENAAFERFYRDHLRKIMLIRQGHRYLGKGNYNISRLAYLRKLFPDARLIVPVRDPLWHIASLMKQHALFSAEERRDPRILAHMRRVGHLEFGLDRRAINVGDGVATEVEALWRDGEEVRGWARYWNSLYRFVARQRAFHPAMAEATLIVRYEDLCGEPQTVLTDVLAHAGLEASTAEIERLARRVSPPGYYAPRFDAAEQAIIMEETREARGLLDYA
jgi:hypothetical protein